MRWPRPRRPQRPVQSGSTVRALQSPAGYPKCQHSTALHYRSSIFKEGVFNAPQSSPELSCNPSPPRARSRYCVGSFRRQGSRASARDPRICGAAQWTSLTRWSRVLYSVYFVLDRAHVSFRRFRVPRCPLPVRKGFETRIDARYRPVRTIYQVVQYRLCRTIARDRDTVFTARRLAGTRL